MVIAGAEGWSTALRSGERGFARLWQLIGPTYTGTEGVPETWLEGASRQCGPPWSGG